MNKHTDPLQGWGKTEQQQQKPKYKIFVINDFNRIWPTLCHIGYSKYKTKQKLSEVKTKQNKKTQKNTENNNNPTLIEGELHETATKSELKTLCY